MRKATLSLSAFHCKVLLPPRGRCHVGERLVDEVLRCVWIEAMYPRGGQLSRCMLMTNKWGIPLELYTWTFYPTTSLLHQPIHHLIVGSNVLYSAATSCIGLLLVHSAASAAQAINTIARTSTASTTRTAKRAIWTRWWSKSLWPATWTSAAIGSSD